MAGIGFELRKIFKKNSITSLIEGIGYSSLITIGPMVVVVGMLLLIFQVVDYSSLPYTDRELLSSTILYVFIFSLLFTSPFNSVLSRYVADKIYEEKFEDILPCFYTGLVMNLFVVVGVSIPFFLHEIIKGGVSTIFVFGSFCMYITLTILFYSMLYLSATKDYKIISIYFLTGMLVALFCVVVLVYVFLVSIPSAVIYGMSCGFLLTASLEFSYLKKYFYRASNHYFEVLHYFKRYYKLFLSNLFYTLGLFIHNFVFWFSPLKHVVANTYISAQPYDMATCLAMFTNISVTVIFIVQMETKFSLYYKDYTECVTGGTYRMIEKAKNRMFGMLNQQIVNIIQIQFIISMVLFLLAIIFLPSFGVSGKAMLIYPVLAAAYFVIFIMYCMVIFLYYFDDETGAMITTATFCMVTLLGSLISKSFSVRYYGLGVFLGALCGWTVGYFRLLHLEKTFDAHIFCRGKAILERREDIPDNCVYQKEDTKGKEVLNHLITVIMLADGTKKELIERIESLERQTYQNFELLLLYESNLEEKKSFCEEYARHCPNIIVIPTQKKTKAEVIGDGIMAAKGEFILFMNGKETLDAEQALEKLLREGLQAKADIVVGDLTESYPKRTQARRKLPPWEKANTNTFAFRFRAFFSYGLFSYLGGKLYKKDFFVQEKITMRPLLCGYDWLFLVECYSKDARITFLSEEIGVRRVPYHSILVEGYKEKPSAWNECLSELECILKERKKEKEYRDLLGHFAFFIVLEQAKREYRYKGRRIKPVKQVFRQYHGQKQIRGNIRGLIFGKHTKLYIRLFALLSELHLDTLQAYIIRLIMDFSGDL